MTEMGYYSGLRSIHLFAIQYAVILSYVFQEVRKGRTSITKKVIVGIALLLVVLALWHILFTWTDTMNIAARIDLEDAVRASKPFFWIEVVMASISALLYLAVIITDVVYVRKEKK